MQNQIFININGKICNDAEAKISVLDHALLYGDSIFEVLRCYQGKIPFYAQHMQRLKKSASYLGYPEHFIDIDKILKQIYKTLSFAKLKEASIRITITSGIGAIGLDPSNLISTSTLIFVQSYASNPDWYTEGVKIISAKKNIQGFNLKTGNYLNNILFYRKAISQGAFDSLLLDSKNQVKECSLANFWIVKNNHIYTPPLSSNILEGITRKTLLSLLKENSIPHSIQNFRLHEALVSDECFLSSSLKTIVPVIQIDDGVIKSGRPGPVSLKLLKLYLDHIKEQVA